MISTKTVIAVALVLTLSGCSLSQSRLNPFNWFGGDEEKVEMVDDTDIVAIADNRPLVQNVTALVTERLPGGIIVRATGLPTAQGWYDAQLVREGRAASGTGVIVFSFRARPPETATRVSTQQSREIVAGAFLSDIELIGVSSIRVLAASNARTVGR